MSSDIIHSSPIRLLWFDSLGAKSSSFIIEGNGCNILVDPGAAAMQPSYPLPEMEKHRLRSKALGLIREALSRNDVRAVIITHYHYDHHPRPGDPELPITLFRGKLVLAKNPNYFINESQWRRARTFFESLAKVAGIRVDELYKEPGKLSIGDPEKAIPKAMARDFGDYSGRRAELLEKGRKWFEGLAELWATGEWVSEFSGEDGTRVIWADGRELEICGIRLRFTEPWFHGVEYDRTGWVVGLLAEFRGRRVFFTSDVMGPIIEDYAEAVAAQRPDLVIVDGPPTYLYPYMLNKINLRRAVENAVTIVRSRPGVMIYDHHLLRERAWRRRVSEVFEVAEEEGVRVLTAAEALGRAPLIDLISRG